ncbi:hypothetical protein AXG93_3954s1080 [Marchantia polymorpha subsp. ruderalis]|uniref:Uncharacterized protein n=1 Tax=Marchantia polymorpha subsp. ruderalis TaxID=1480154 RepID=A0A176VKC6_MARPO|nr:hypothetical protein AXG93_3954s1080 [Marchantia polymorpha subsp. ruderalis]
MLKNLLRWRPEESKKFVCRRTLRKIAEAKTVEEELRIKLVEIARADKKGGHEIARVAKENGEVRGGLPSSAGRDKR